MKLTASRLTALALVASTRAVVSEPAHAADQAYVASEVVTSYVSGNSPTMILSFDNNLEICLALRQPASEEDLRNEGIVMTQSQILVLKLWGLIESDESGLLRFRLPVIDGSKSAELDRLSRTVASGVLDASRDEIAAFMQAVRDAGWSGNGYVLVGSYVLDGLVWTALEQEGLLSESDATSFVSGSDYWSGLSWVTLPPRPKTLGTNSMLTGNGTVHAAWTPKSLEAQNALWQRERLEAIASVATGQMRSQTKELDTLAELGLVDDSGNPMFPVIESGSAVCKRAGILARKIAQTLDELPELRKMMKETAAEDPSAALIMAHHWIYPALLNLLESEGLSPPPILGEGVASGLAGSLFVVPPGTNCVEAGD